MLRKHLTDWLIENGSVSEHSRVLASRVVDEVIDECVSSTQSKKSDWHLKNKKETRANSSEECRVFDSVADFWRFGFPNRVSVLRGKSPDIRQSIAADIVKNKDLPVPVIEKDSYKGNASVLAV